MTEGMSRRREKKQKYLSSHFTRTQVNPRKFDEDIIGKLLKVEEKVRDTEASLAEQLRKITGTSQSNTLLRQHKEKRS